MQFPFCTGQRLKEKHNLPHLYKPEEKQALAFLYELKSQKRSSSFRYPPRLGGKSKKGARPLFGRFKGKGFSREGGNRNPPSLERVFGYFLHEQKVTRGPGPGRPRGRKPAQAYPPRRHRQRRDRRSRCRQTDSVSWPSPAAMRSLS